MKTLRLIGLLAWSTVFASAGSPPASADADWAALQSHGLLEFKFSGSLTAREIWDARERHAQALRREGLAFYESHPADPRRWIIVWQMLLVPPRFITSYGPNFEKEGKDFAADAAAAAAWKSRLDELEAALGAANDVPADVRESFDLRAVAEPLGHFLEKNRNGLALQTADCAPVLARIAAFGRKYPESGQAFGLMKWFMTDYEPVNPFEKSAAVWRQFAGSPNRLLAEKAQERVRFFELAAHPLELQFTAADGQAVDLEKLRGKVVLIDFWATWCGTCIEELPNVRKVYAAYHGKGFEVIGISLEMARLSSKDTAEQTAAKLAKAKKVLMDFTASHGMPWPQYFDGKYWDNDIATRYAIHSAPTMLLLDQEGKLVSDNARGDTLEATVKKLLKL